MIKENGRIKRKLLISGFLATMIFFIGLNSWLVERLYSDQLYRFISGVQRTISGIFPFSIGDILYVLFIAYVLFRAISYLKRLKASGFSKPGLLAAPLGLLNFTLVLYIAFKLLWGLNYSRPSIAEQLQIGNEKYSPAQLTALAKFMIKRINALQLERLKIQNPSSLDYTASELEFKATAAYQEMHAKHPFFSYSQPALKKVLNTWLITKIGLEGYYNPLSGEANVNMRIPAHGLPFVACHEIAHQLGVGREDEANLVGYLVAANSTDLNFRYSAMYSVLRNVLFELRIKSPDAYKPLAALINEGTKLDFQRDKDFWLKYNSDMYAYMDVALDSFLKLNNQQKGINSYQDIVIWVYNLHKKEL
jgi:hypothetical protein